MQSMKLKVSWWLAKRATETERYTCIVRRLIILRMCSNNSSSSADVSKPEVPVVMEACDLLEFPLKRWNSDCLLNALRMCDAFELWKKKINAKNMVTRKVKR